MEQDYARLYRMFCVLLFWPKITLLKIHLHVLLNIILYINQYYGAVDYGIGAKLGQTFPESE